jgi:hypothetical protein
MLGRLDSADQIEGSTDGGVLVEILHKVVVTLLSLLVQKVFRRVLQVGRQILVQHLAGPS